MRMESELSALRKERTAEALKVDMAIINIREEADPLLDPLEIGINKLEIAVGTLKGAIERIQEIDVQIKKIQRLM